MRKTFFYLSLSTLLLTAACSESIIATDDNTSNDVETTGVPVKFQISGTEAQPNDPTTVGFLAKFATPATTRTAFADANVTNALKGVSAQINWSANDQITVYQAGFSESGNTITTTDYKVTAGEVAKADIEPVSGAMEWQKDKTGFRFIATYPKVNATGYGITAVTTTPATGNAQDYANYLTVTVKPNNEQTCTVDQATYTDGNTLWKFAQPDMNNALMIGADEQLATRPMAENEVVKLNFHPIMSTLMVGVSGPATASTFLKGIKIYLKDNAGNPTDFATTYNLSYQLQNQTWICNKVKASAGKVAYYYIKLNTPVEVGSKDGKNIKCMFTAFLPPHEIAVGKQQIQVVPEFVESASADAIASDWYTTTTIGRKTDSYFRPSSKLLVYTGALNTKFAMNKWMKYIPDNAYIRDLSLPGAHSALNHDYNSVSGGTRYSEASRSANQAVTLRAMLNAGIRALDLSIGDDGQKAAGLRYGRSLAIGDNTFTNKVTDGALQQLLAFLKENPTETVVALISLDSDYYTVGDRFYSYGTAKDQFIEELMKKKTAWKDSEKQESGIVYFKNDLTLADCRGKLILMIKHANRKYNSSRTYFNGDQTVEEGNLRYGGICFLPDWETTDWYNAFDYYKGEGKYADDYLDMFADKDTYYSAQLYPGTKDIGAMAFKKTAMKPLSNNNTSPQDGTLYYLQKDFASKRTPLYYTSYTPYTHYWNTTTDDSKKQTFGGDNSNAFKATVVKDFLDMAGSNRFTNDWFITVVPAWSGGDGVHEHYGSGSINDTWNVNTKKTNTWASNYIETHQPILDYLRDNLGRGRKGIVFFDIVPGRNNNGDYEYKYTTMGYNDPQYDGNNSLTETKKNIGKEMTRLLIMDNIMRTLKKAQP